MNTLDVLQGASNRNERLRLLMLLIVAATVPFYCFALYIIGSAPVPAESLKLQATLTAPPAASFTPLGANFFPTASATSPSLLPTYTPLRLPAVSTPLQIVPPTAIPAPTIAPPSPTRAITNDRDFDGLPDQDDNCPDDGGFVDAGGCPYPDDADRDGFRDAQDACPREHAPYSARGCQDFDDDGLDSADDACPDRAGPRSNRGCPEGES
ncbi:MAG: hypothetical protein OXG92_11105 [Chloroflexi bacterium]|nr:hypothetical protein [Chloroflexota bacterium]MCY3582445.1 hypothetical protein [Chloroflexota bacterium]MCY3717001.1 hypothetical protein [Chloroflexota bacterium]MDE2652077.1 hypothetical protein [Chloroflexota bacterium]MXX50159.1 hypothetical protein [Chloroflexota bacterium]